MSNLYVSTAGGTNKNDTTFGKKTGENTLKNLLQPNKVKTGNATLKSGVLPQANTTSQEV